MFHRVALLALLIAQPFLNSSAAPPIELPYEVELAAFDPFQPRLAVVPKGTNQLHLIDLNDGSFVRSFDLSAPARSLAFTPNGRRLYIASAVPRIIGVPPVPPPRSGYIAEVRLDGSYAFEQKSIQFAPDDIVATDDGRIVIATEPSDPQFPGGFPKIDLITARMDSSELHGSISFNSFEVNLALHPAQEIIYAVEVGFPYSRIQHIRLAGSGELTNRWMKEFLEQAVEKEVYPYPNGSGIYSDTGWFFTSSNEQFFDLAWGGTNSFRPKSVAYATNGTVFAAVGESKLLFYDYGSHQEIDRRDAWNAAAVGLYNGRAAVLSTPANQPATIQFMRPTAKTAEENIPPVVVLSAEHDGRRYPAETALHFEAESFDEDGPAGSLKFFQNGNEIGSTPQSVGTVAATVLPGTNEFYVVAYDLFNGAGTSAVVRVTGNALPTVGFVNPPRYVDGLARTTFRAAASDTDGSVAEVRLLSFGEVIATDTEAPYEFQFDPTAVWAYSFVLEAVDNEGAVGTSEGIFVTFTGFVDRFASASSMVVMEGTDLSVSGSTQFATRQKDEPEHAGKLGGRSVWCAWRAPSLGRVVLDTHGSNFDTLLGVYSSSSSFGTVDFSTLVPVASNDDDLSLPPASRVKFTARKGTVYFIAIDGYEGAGGEAKLSIQFTPAEGPLNDLLADAIPLSFLGQVATNGGATKEPFEPAHAGNNGGASLWWRLNTVGSGAVVTLTTAGSSFDTLLAVYTNVAGPMAVPTSMNDLRLVAANDDSGGVGMTSTVRFTNSTRSSVTYWVAVDGYNGETGVARIIRPEAAWPPTSRPTNDLFAKGIVLSGPAVITNGSTFMAGRESFEPLHNIQSRSLSVWYRWTAPTNGLTLISTKGSDFDTVLAVYTGTNLAGLTLVAANDDSPSGGETSSVLFHATAGTTYQIAIADYNYEWGNTALAINQTTSPIVRLLSYPSAGGISVSFAGPPVPVLLMSSTNLVDWSIDRTLQPNELVHITSEPEEAVRFFRIWKPN